MGMFNDSSGKISAKRILGFLAVISGLLMAFGKPFVESVVIWSDTLILGIIASGFAAVAVGVSEKWFNNKPGSNTK